MSVGKLLTLGLGTFGSASRLLTLGLDIGAAPAALDLRRFSLVGASQQRISLVGASQQRIDLDGAHHD